MNTTSVVYELPFGKGRRFGSKMGGVFDAVAGGWAINAINSANTGIPLDVSYTPAAANDGTGRIPDYRGEAIMRPNVSGDTTGSSGPAMLDNYFNKTAFSIPTASAPYGNLGRNALRAPGFWQMDVGLNKRFTIPAREGMSIQFRSEFFNILNRSNFGLPTCDVTNAAFGTIRSTYPPRQIQFALKLMF
jgi:hypothetical protein